MYNPDLRSSPAAVVASKTDLGDCEDNVAALRSETMLPVIEVRFVRSLSCAISRVVATLLDVVSLPTAL